MDEDDPVPADDADVGAAFLLYNKSAGESDIDFLPYQHVLAFLDCTSALAFLSVFYRPVITQQNLGALLLDERRFDSKPRSDVVDVPSTTQSQEDPRRRSPQQRLLRLLFSSWTDKQSQESVVLRRTQGAGARKPNARHLERRIRERKA